MSCFNETCRVPRVVVRDAAGCCCACSSCECEQSTRPGPCSVRSLRGICTAPSDLCIVAVCARISVETCAGFKVVIAMPEYNKRAAAAAAAARVEALEKAKQEAAAKAEQEALEQAAREAEVSALGFRCGCWPPQAVTGAEAAEQGPHTWHPAQSAAQCRWAMGMREVECTGKHALQWRGQAACR